MTRVATELIRKRRIRVLKESGYMFHLNSQGSEAVARAFIKCGVDELLGIRKISADATTQHLPAAIGDNQRSAIPSTEPVRETLATLGQIHLINLDRSSQRLLRFREYNSHLKEVVRVSATDGAVVDREALINSGYVNRDLPYSDGTLGCAVSHLKLWEMAASQDRSLTIFEDDIVVSLHFEARAREVLAAVPADWDLIQWGVSFDPVFVWVDLGVSKARLQPYGKRNYAAASDYERFQAEEFLPAPLRLLHSFGTLGYSISAKGARAALEYCLPLRNRSIQFPGAGVTTEDAGIDAALCGLYPALKAYVCFPQLLIPNDEESVRKAIDKEVKTGLVGKAA